jgi:hypothetical protein
VSDGWDNSSLQLVGIWQGIPAFNLLGYIARNQLVRKTIEGLGLSPSIIDDR